MGAVAQAETRVQRAVLLRRERGVSRIWAVGLRQCWQDPPGFRLVHMWRPDERSAGLGLYRRCRGASR
ncbi:MAG TPA: hypothetical protein DHU96_31500 [Actinobacteria bacterium]|nr:hypothetical protein [Actinomycetota bacterium]